MTLFGLLLGVWVGIVTYAALVLVLRHLKALHLTSTQCEQIHGSMALSIGPVMGDIKALMKDLEDTKAKLAALGNRVR